MKQVLTGNQAAAHGFRLARLDVFGNYPITPVTEVGENMARFHAEGLIAADYVNTDSEYASCALGIGVSSAGGRYGIATSSQGLLYMFEPLHWASLARLPFVIANANRSVGPPWSIYPDMTDSVLCRDLFLPQLYCETVQEVCDMILWAYRLAEDQRVLLPVLVNFDGFMLSHTAENAELPDGEAMREFLGNPPSGKIDDTKIQSINAPGRWQERMRRTKETVEAMGNACLVMKDVARRWNQYVPKRTYQNPFLEVSGDSKAPIAVLSIGSITGTIREALKERTVKVIGLRLFRPFPVYALMGALCGVSQMIVIDRSVLPDGRGALAHDLRLRRHLFRQDLWECIGGLGGQNLSEKDFLSILEKAKQSRPPVNPYWIGE